MNPETPTKARRARRSMLFHLDRELLLPPGLKGVPEPISEANRIATEAFEKVEAAESKARELAAQAEAAPRHDENVRQAAIAAGEKVPKPTAERKHAEALEARKQAEAAEQVAKLRIRDLYDCIEDNCDAYLDSRRKAAEEALDPVREAIPRILGSLVEFRQANVILQAAARWENNPASHVLSGNPGNTERQFEKARARQAAQVYPEAVVEFDLVELLAALERCIEREIEGRS